MNKALAQTYVVALILTSVSFGCNNEKGRDGNMAKKPSGESPVSTNPAGTAPKLFTEVPQSDLNKYANQLPAFSEIKESPTTENFRVVRVNQSLLKTEPAITLNLFPEEQVVATRDHMEMRSDNDFSWSGSLPNQTGSATLTVHGDNLAGTIDVVTDSEARSYSVRSLGSGLHSITRIDESKFPPDHPKSFNEIEKKSSERPPSSAAEPGGGNAGGTATSPAIVRVLIAFTPAAARLVGDTVLFAQSAVDDMNKGFRNSSITSGSMERAAVIAFNYVESGKDFDQHLAAFRADSNVQKARNDNKADVAVLMVDDLELCGLSADILATANSAFTVMDQSCAVGNHTFAHEIGHLMGARHNEQCDSNSTGGRRYVHGFRVLGAWRTIMAYRCEDTTFPRPCGSNPQTCGKVNQWSNPRLTFGTPPRATGTVALNDNVRLLNETLPIVSRFRN